MIGVGKLGQDCAEVMAKIYDVVGYDIEPKNTALRMCSSIREAVEDRDIIFIAAPTPHDVNYGGETPTSHLPNKDFDYSIVIEILNEVNLYANKSQLIVLISTVLPGTVRSLLKPCITNARFIYNPYLIAMGTVKWDMVNPEMVIIGTEDGSITGDAKELIDFYNPLMNNNPRYEIGTWDEAESIKIFYNTFISTKLALVNMIQDVAEKNGNINVDIVTNALSKSTYRITGPAYMKAGMGDAGACHPRDNIALRYLSDKLDLGYDLFDAIMKAREVQAENMALKCLKNGKNITIIGKAYKPGVPYINGSASMLVGHYIEKHGGSVNYYDENTKDLDLKKDWTDVYLIGYWENWVKNLHLPESASVIDPWRQAKNFYRGMEIIYYGDSRPQDPCIPTQHNLDAHRNQVFDIWPELFKYENQIHVVYANVNNQYSFLRRSVESICKEILDAKKEGKSKFFFHNLSEGAMPNIISKIHKIAKLLEKEIDISQFFYLNSATNLEEVYNNFVEKRGWDKKINVLAANYFYYTSKNGIDRGYYNYYKNEIEYNVNIKEKKFLCFNKLNREHRMHLLEKMFQLDLVDKAFYSFEGDGNWFNNIELSNSIQFINILKNKSKFPLRLNITENRHNPVDIIPDDVQYFKNSYFSVVTETLFFSDNIKVKFHKTCFSDCIFLSEKIYKCFIIPHPFILVTRPHTLKYLQSMGFKTFSPYIDESYDDIEDDYKRLDKIANEILRICNLPDEEIIELQKNIKPMVDHNHQHFFNNDKFKISEAIQFFE